MKNGSVDKICVTEAVTTEERNIVSKERQAWSTLKLHLHSYISHGDEKKPTPLTNIAILTEPPR